MEVSLRLRVLNSVFVRKVNDIRAPLVLKFALYLAIVPQLRRRIERFYFIKIATRMLLVTSLLVVHPKPRPLLIEPCSPFANCYWI